MNNEQPIDPNQFNGRPVHRKLGDLSDAGREELALMILLWRDFKKSGPMDMEIVMQSLEFAIMLGVKDKFESLMGRLPPMKIEPRL